MSASDSKDAPTGSTPSQLRSGLQRLIRQDQPPSWHLGARLRNYFLTGLVIVGPVTITLYFAWWFINVTDAWIKPFVPKAYLPDTYLPFAVPGFGLIVGIVALTLIGALAANLLGRTLISFGEQMVGGMPIVRNVYRALKQIFEFDHHRHRPRPGLSESRAHRVPVEGPVVDRVRYRRDHGRGGSGGARRRERSADRVHADRHRAADGVRMLPAAAQRGDARHDHRGCRQGDHLGRHGDAGEPGQAARDGRAGQAQEPGEGDDGPPKEKTPRPPKITTS